MLNENRIAHYIVIAILLVAAGATRAQTGEHDRRAAAQLADPAVAHAEVMYAATLPPATGSEDARQLLNHVQKSIAENNPDALQRYFASKVYLSLLTGKEGYFSAEQSYFIIRNFFLSYTPIGFSYSNSTAESDNPYGVGTLQYVARGQHGKAQLFVSLARVKNDWRISQITVTNR